MSFKREGNDTNLLGNLQKRRIKELLSEEIPEDEAKLLCNGRFACTVCPSNPIFDTVSMLSVHRSGKKHLFSLEIHEKKKKELKQLIARRRHEQFLKDGTTSIKMAVHEHTGILTTSPYDPCVKKVKKGKRKPILDLNSEPDVVDELNTPKASDLKDLPGNSSHWQKVCERQLSGPIKHDHQLKNIFKSKTETSVRLSPYQRQKSSSTSKSDNYSPGTYSYGQQNHLSKPLHSRQYGQSAGLSSSMKTLYTYTSTSKSPQIPHTNSPVQQKMTGLYNRDIQDHVFGSGSNLQLMSLVRTTPPPPPPPPSSANSDGQILSQPTGCVSLNSKYKTNSVDMEMKKSAEQNLVTQKLRQLQGSGWKRDWDGKWIKDENAEFDSDEEPPDIP